MSNRWQDNGKYVPGAQFGRNTVERKERDAMWRAMHQQKQKNLADAWLRREQRLERERTSGGQRAALAEYFYNKRIKFQQQEAPAVGPNVVNYAYWEQDEPEFLPGDPYAPDYDSGSGSDF